VLYDIYILTIRQIIAIAIGKKKEGEYDYEIWRKTATS